MLEPRFRIQSASGQQRILQADRGSFPKRGSHVKLIIPLQVASINDAEDLLLVIQPIDLSKLGGNTAELSFQPFRSRYVVAALQGSSGGSFIALVHFPLKRRSGMLLCAGVSNIEHIPQFGVISVGVDEGYALGAAPDIPPHGLVPEVVLRAGGGIWPLGVDHELLVIRVLIKPCGGGQKPCPCLVAACDLLGRAVCQLRVGLGCIWHLSLSPLIVVDAVDRKRLCAERETLPAQRRDVDK